MGAKISVSLLFVKQKDKIGAPADLQWRSLWSQTAPEPCVFAPLMGPLDTEVVIVGGGIAGLSTALHLAENGISVVVLEGRQPGAGASGQSGGQVIPGLRHFRSDLIKAYGQDLGLRAHAFGSAAADIVFDLIARRAITCDAVRQGWVQAADSPAALAQSESRVAEWRARSGI
jgi:glycine/D-amino acid oxidase-like deaminating enzyme